MNRTRSKLAVSSEHIFLDGVSHAVRSTLDAMIEENVTIATLAKTCCGVYSGRHKWISEEFVNVVNNVLSERMGAYTRGHFFHQVLIPELPVWG